MPKYKIKYVVSISIIIFLLLFIGESVVFGKNSDESSVVNQEIKDLNNDIQDKKRRMNRIQKEKEEYSKAIEQKQSQKASLNNQLAILDNRMAKTEIDIEFIETDIGRKELEVKKTNYEIEEKNKAIDNKKDEIASVIQLIYKTEQVGTLEIMLLNDTFSDFISQFRYLEDMSGELKNSLDDIEEIKRRLEEDIQSLAWQSEDLEKLKQEVLAKRGQLVGEKDSKMYILDQVNQSEKEYQRLLVQLKKEQEDAAAEIVIAEKSVRAKLAELEGGKLEFNDNGFIWPIPKNTITSYFHDPDYPFRHIFEHPAIDVRASQGTSLKAAASGYVAKVKDGSDGSYAYIMIVHGDGLSTVYSHPSKIFVKEGEYVVQGQKIGLTGGMPGTPGAGRFTTGPHLHFEVRKNGIPVDPLNYLP